MRGEGFARVLMAPLNLMFGALEVGNMGITKAFKYSSWTSSVGGLFGLDIPNIKKDATVTTPFFELPLLEIPW